MSNGYRKLTRQDLRGFNNEATDMILAAMEAGAKGRISSKGHCIIQAPNGSTMSVTPNPSKANRGSQNQRTEFRRVFGMDVSEAMEKEKAPSMPTVQPVPKPPPSRTLECPVKDCEATFVTEGARYSHIEKEHVKCPVPGCDWAGKNERARYMHHRVVHEGFSARRVGAQRKREREREAAAAKPKPPPKQREAPKPPTMRRSDPEALGLEPTDAERTLQVIREALGVDPRVAELEAERDQLRGALNDAQRRVEELEAKLKLLKEAIEL